MHINRVIISPGIMLLACVLAVGNVQASSVFTGSVSGYFDNPVASRWDYVDIENNQLNDDGSTSSVFSWGLTHNAHKRGRNRGHNRRGYDSFKSSNFEFEGVASDSASSDLFISADQAFFLGDFTYTNEATVFSRHVEGVDFSLVLELDGYGRNEFTYTLGLFNTPNSCVNSSDYVSLLNSVESQSLQIGNDWYELEILGFSRDGGSTFETAAWLDEGASTSAGVYAQLNTVSAVPIPAAAWLFGSGFLWLAAIARKPFNRKR